MKLHRLVLAGLCSTVALACAASVAQAVPPPWSLPAAAPGAHAARPQKKKTNHGKLYTFEWSLYNHETGEYESPENLGEFRVCGNKSGTWGFEGECGYGTFTTRKFKKSKTRYTIFRYKNEPERYLEGLLTAHGWNDGVYYFGNESQGSWEAFESFEN